MLVATIGNTTSFLLEKVWLAQVKLKEFQKLLGL